MSAKENGDGAFQTAADGWYMLVPIGEFLHNPTGLMQVVDAESVLAMAAQFGIDAQAENFPGLLVDVDHFSLDSDKPSEAAGWIFKVEARLGADEKNPGLWGQIRWSDKGAEGVKGGRYRLISPVFPRSACLDLGGGRVRALKLERAALTNDPNMRGMVPLSNRVTASPNAGDARSQNSESSSQNPTDRIQESEDRIQNDKATTKLANDAKTETGRFKWVLGAGGEGGRHCPSCANLAGQVHTMEEWNAAGIIPGSGRLLCTAHCLCSLEATEDEDTGPIMLGNTARTRVSARSACPGFGDYLATGRMAVRAKNVEILRMVTQQANRKGAGEAKMSKQTGAEETETEKLTHRVAALETDLAAEKIKNAALIEEIDSVETDLVNRSLKDFADVVSDDTREFWREQLLTNRAGAEKALTEMAALKTKDGAGSVRRPLHNRAAARATGTDKGAGGGDAGRSGGDGDDGKAGKIRNRAHEIARVERIPFSSAFRRAEKEVGGK